jgi:NhaP-type Na+/H+ or K+/H+ antiporter
VTFTLWYVVAGLLLVSMALFGSVLRRLPLTTSIPYLLVGVALGPHGAGLLDLNPVEEPELLHRLAELAVIVSLFAAGLKLRVAWRDPRWRLPLRLATLSMLVTVMLIALRAWSRWACRPLRRSCWARCWHPPTRCWPPRWRSTPRKTRIASGSA